MLDPELGWAWKPGTEWAPAWVVWRRGHHHIGWAPLPPDEAIAEYREEPHAWIFVDTDEFTEPDIARYVIPYRDGTELVRTAVVANETVVAARHRGFAVNPGIAPNVVAAISGRPIHAYQVQPLVLAGTARIPNAVEVQGQQLRERRAPIPEARVEQTQSTINPAAHVPEPTPLKPGEHDRLGENPPHAAQMARGPENLGNKPGKTNEQLGNRPTEERRQRANRGRQPEAQGRPAESRRSELKRARPEERGGMQRRQPQVQHPGRGQE